MNALHGEASSHHAGVLHVPGLEGPGVDAVLPSEHAESSTECVDHVEDEGLAVVGLCPRVLLPVGGVQVQQQHLAPGHRGEVGLHLVVAPPGTEEQPALHHPHSLGVSGGHPGVDRPADTGQVLQRAVGRIHLVESVAVIEMIAPELLGLLSDEHRPNLLEQGVQRGEEVGAAVLLGESVGKPAGLGE